MQIDFTSAALTYRRKFGGGKGQLIAKAIGLSRGLRPSIIDATAGLGKDSFILASLGCRVQMIERSPVIATMLEEALQKAAHVQDMAEVIARMSLTHGDAITLLATLPSPDVIYLDPMFPPRTKSALVKKEMRDLHALVGEDRDSAQLLTAALAKARYRVVVKRPRIAPTIEGIAPSYTMEGKSGRFDVYVLKGMEKP